jgi:hypothetical protein
MAVRSDLLWMIGGLATKKYHRVFADPRVRRAADGIAFHPYWATRR